MPDSKERQAINWLAGWSLDLGVCYVDVDVCQIDSNLWGRMLTNERLIELCPDLDGENLSATLWHEIFHFHDKLVLQGAIEKAKGGTEKEHSYLDALSVLVDQTLRRNWPLWERMYGPKALVRQTKKQGPARERQQQRRSQPRG